MPAGPAPACHSESSVNPGTTEANSRSGSGFPTGRAGPSSCPPLGGSRSVHTQNDISRPGMPTAKNATFQAASPNGAVAGSG